MKYFYILWFLAIPFFVSAKSVTMTIPGAVCSMCLQGMKKVFKDVVKNPETDINLDLNTKQLRVNLSTALSNQEIKKRVASAGYNAKNIIR